jgi:hypothetical protein
MRSTKKVTPTEPGIWFTGNTETGDFIYQVIIAPNSFLSQNSLEEFYRWKAFADASKSLGLLLRFYFQYLTENDGNLKHEVKEELMLMVIFLSSLAQDDFKRVADDRDNLLQESLK